MSFSNVHDEIPKAYWASPQRKKEGESEKEEGKKDSRHHPSWPFKESSCGVYEELAQFHTSLL